ncbi:MAG: hypothetical protein ACRCZC_02425, partial [Culicoidibacterales bacterium]
IIAVLFQLYHLEDYKNYVYLGSGLSESGYSVQRLVKNNYMIPKVFIDFGDYLDSQNEERYQIVAPHIIQYEGGPLELNLGMIMASNKVEMCNSYKGECFNDINQQKQIINDFLMGNIVAFEEFETIAKNYGIDFVVTNDSDVLKTLKENDYEIVVESNSLANEKVYLIDMR